MSDWFLYSCNVQVILHNSLQLAACFTLSWVNMTCTCWCNLFLQLDNMLWFITLLSCGVLFSPQGYDDGYGGEYDDPSYEAYDNSYATQTQR